MLIERFRHLPLLAILRGIEAADVEPLVDCLSASGLESIEITMNTPAAADLIRQFVARARERFVIGAGTVLDVHSFRQARAAGASFIVMPVLIPEVVAQCRAEHVPVFPGALTPQEIHAAWQAGASMVKVFPAGVFGPAYFKEIKGPFNAVQLLACGGVTAENLAAYVTAGADAVAFGGSVFRREWLAERQYDRIGEEVGKLVAAYRNYSSRSIRPL